LLLEYERGAILTGGEDAVFAAGPVRRALEDTAHAADLDDDAVPDYVDAVRAIVWEMAAHGRGGILIVSTEERPDVAEAATYRMAGDSSVASLLRLARHLGRAKGGDRPPQSATAQVAYGSLLRNRFLTEAERLTEELGALTGVDGAILLNRHPALVAFGVMLPSAGRRLAEATDAEGLRTRVVDLAVEGPARRRDYAAEHPGSVAVASEATRLVHVSRRLA
jgi:hypothetical protein